MMGMYYEIDFELWLVSLLFDDERRNSVDDGGWWLMVAVKCTALMKQQRLTAVRFPAFTSSKTTKLRNTKHACSLFAISPACAFTSIIFTATSQQT